jgi:hypothetical protein
MFAGIDPGENTEENELKLCVECGKELFYGMMAICASCNEVLEREEMSISDLDIRRGK